MSAAVAEKAKQIVDAKKKKKQEDKKKELKWLFGGFTENQTDVFVLVLVAIFLGFWGYDKVEWEVRFWPRALESAISSASQDGRITADTAMAYTHQVRFSDAIEKWPADVKDASLVLFHSEFLDGLNMFSPARTMASDPLNPGAVAENSTIALLAAIHAGKVSHVLWVPPDWADHRYLEFEQERFACKVGKVGEAFKVGGCQYPSLAPQSFGPSYFTLSRFAAPLSELQSPVEFSIQVVPVTSFFRRSVNIVLNRIVFMHFDLSFLNKRDYVATTLSNFGVEKDVRNFLKAFIAPERFCFNASEEGDLKAAIAMRQLFDDGFKKGVLHRPRDFFLSQWKPFFQYWCDGAGERHMSEMHLAAEELFPKRAVKPLRELIVKRGYVLPAGGSAAHSESDIKAAGTYFANVFMRRVNWLKPKNFTKEEEMQELTTGIKKRKVLVLGASISDDWSERVNVPAETVVEIKKSFLRFYDDAVGAFSDMKRSTRRERPSEESVEEESADLSEEKKKELFEQRFNEVFGAVPPAWNTVDKIGESFFRMKPAKSSKKGNGNKKEEEKGKEGEEEEKKK